MPALTELTRLRAILALGRSIADEHDLDQLGARVIDTCFQLFQADRCGIVIYEPSSMAPLMSVARDRIGVSFALATCALGRRIGIREPQLQTEVDGDGIYGRTASVRSVIAVPLRFDTDTRWSGMIVLDANAVTQPFSAADLETLDMLAQPVALALKNAMLVRQVQSVIGDEWRRLDRVVRDLPLGIVVIDDRRRCMLVNRWAAARSADLGALPAGLPIETIAGLPCADLIGTDRCTTTTTSSDRILSISANTLTDGRETVIVIVDLIEERERQAQAAHRDRVALVGQLAGGVAHDFNNLLHVILTYSSMLQDSVSDPEQRDDLVQIHHAATSAAELTRQLLAFSRRELVKPKVVDVANVVTGIEKSLRRTVGPTIDLVISVGSRVPRVLIDGAQLDQILMNLIVNARDATPGDGSILLAVRDVDVDPVWAAERNILPGRYAGIEVSDTGSGMPADVAARIFEPYFTTKARGQGSGLGLATVHGIVQQAKGDIHVDSQVGHGTTFHILLPATDQPTETRPIPVIAPNGAATILVVDDDDHVRRATERILRAAGYAVLSATSGHNAMAFAREHHGAIDLLLTDVVMPGMSGRDLAREILAIGATDRVVFMSGYHQTGPMGSSQFISKPFQRVDLIEKVRAALGNAPEPRAA